MNENTSNEIVYIIFDSTMLTNLFVCPQILLRLFIVDAVVVVVVVVVIHYLLLLRGNPDIQANPNQNKGAINYISAVI